jgi:hypothetical protein
VRLRTANSPSRLLMFLDCTDHDHQGIDAQPEYRAQRRCHSSKQHPGDETVQIRRTGPEPMASSRTAR